MIEKSVWCTQNVARFLDANDEWLQYRVELW